MTLGKEKVVSHVGGNFSGDKAWDIFKHVS
jgi:hypothetical protein